MSDKAHAETHQNEGDNNVTRFEEGKSNAHDLLDSKDERSIANKLAAAEASEKASDKASEEEDEVRPTDIAKAHGNKPSRGAIIDEQIEDEERAELERKGKA